MLDIPQFADALEGVNYELVDCALPTLAGKFLLCLPFAIVTINIYVL